LVSRLILIPHRHLDFSLKLWSALLIQFTIDQMSSIEFIIQEFEWTPFLRLALLLGTGQEGSIMAIRTNLHKLLLTSLLGAIEVHCHLFPCSRTWCMHRIGVAKLPCPQMAPLATLGPCIQPIQLVLREHTPSSIERYHLEYST
jgi:hypothetical protein